jgi:glycine hydroxymethyltransferase
MRSVSDGYVLFDNDDVYRKAQGPVVVNDLATTERAATLFAVIGPKAKEIITGALGSLEDAEAATCTIAGECVFVCADGDDFYVIVLNAVTGDIWQRLRKAGAVAGEPKTYEEYSGKIGLPQSGSSIKELNEAHSELFDPAKPYFVGSAHVERPAESGKNKKQYKYEPKDEPVIRTCLYEEHLKLGKPRMAAFAGHEMPVWYTSIIDEHRAVRETAGLFDVSHMGVLDVRGRDACQFMDMVSSNYIVRLRPGQSIYGYLFYPDGTCVDDILTYCISHEHYMVVFNAANIQKDLDWINAISTGEIIIDESRPWITPPRVDIRYLKDESAGGDMIVDVALQGPSSLPTILKLAGGDRLLQGRIRRIKRTDFIDCELAGLPLLLSRTGYTGEQYGYEFYIHPQQAPELWSKVLDAGEEFGVKPTGLGARDSTRTEAGLPLYGHELEDESKVNPIEAGYGPFVKLHKPFFIGRDHAVKMAENRDREVCRFKTTGGMRKVNPGNRAGRETARQNKKF